MSWFDDHMHEYLNEQGELTPPWVKYPQFDAYSIGWRMGMGETWLCLWQAFVEALPDTAARESYLRHYPKAPHAWASSILWALDLNFEDEASPEDIARLETMGLIAADIAYPTWLEQQPKELVWPWENEGKPLETARHDTRLFWFWARAFAKERDQFEFGCVPDSWSDYLDALKGHCPRLNLDRGLESLCQQLCACDVRPPWHFGLSPKDHEESFEMDMDYSSAFVLWAMSVFDDQPTYEAYLRDFPPPPNWRPWLRDNIGLDFKLAPAPTA